MNIAIEVDETPTATIYQIIEIVSTDLKPIPFSSEIKTTPQTSSSSTYSQEEQIATTATMTMIRIPCRARGVCDTHTPSSAYFEIPEDCQHGKLLACSHNLCRDSGRCFRYCKPCNKVMAKRNFTKRHAHEISSIRRSSVEFTPVDSAAGSNIKKRKLSVDDVGDENASSLASSLFVNANFTSGEDVISDASRSIPSTIFARTDSNNGDSSGTMLIMMSQREAGLLELVRSRPGDDDQLATNRWIRKILDATDSEKKMMTEDILTDDEEIATQQSPGRMQSLDIFDIFTESFDHLGMK